MGRPDLCKTSLCQRWAKGACPLEAGECRFAHGRLDLRATPNFMHGSGEGEFGQPSDQPLDEFGGLEPEAPLLSTSGNSSNAHVARGGGAVQPPPRMWEEQDNFQDANYMNGGGHDMMAWGSRNHNNHGNGNEALVDQMQAVLAQRDWQWSPEYGDGLQDGDGHLAARNGARPQRARAAKVPAAGAIGPMGTGVSGAVVAPSTPSNGSNGRTHQMPQQLQQMFAASAEAQSGCQPLPEPKLQPPPQWPPPPPMRESVQPVGGGFWGESQQARGANPAAVATYTGGSQQNFIGGPEAMQPFEFPHAITPPAVNIMNPTVPQEVARIWG